MNNRKPLWDENYTTTNTPLRRPNSSLVNSMIMNQAVPPSHSSLNRPLESSPSDILATSKLSVNAKEFVPACYATEPSSSSNRRSVQNRLLKFKQPQPEAYQNETQLASTPNLSDLSSETLNDITKMNNIIQTLTTDPGQYDKLLGTFIETLGPYYDDINVVINTTVIIFNHALNEPNFRYTAARLCSAIEEQCQLFRSHLYILCDKRIKEKCDANLTLFLAELFTHLQFENLYGQCVIQALQHLLKFNDPNTVKAVCQVIKLAGAALDSYHKSDLDKIFDQLNRLKAEASSTSIVNQLNSVFNLRASKWGQEQHHTSDTINNGYQNICNEPIYYGPDGLELTDEEQQFLTENYDDEVEFLNDDSDPDGVWDPDPEMDDEMQAAFRDFIQGK